MAKCRNHPEVEAAYTCMKYKYSLCEACISCKDPDFYCKYRSACAIHYLEKEKKKEKVREFVLP
jgi:hypothetical protein